MAPPRSNVWTHFSKLDGKIAVCKYCLQNVKYCGNTSNLKKHLNKHPGLAASRPQRCISKNQSKLVIDKTTSLKIQNFDGTSNSPKITGLLSQTKSQRVSTTSKSIKSPKTIEFCFEDSETEDIVDCPVSIEKSSLVLKQPIVEAFNPLLQSSVVLKQPIVEAFNRISSYSEGGVRYSKITMSMLYFICKDRRPFTVIEGEGFKRLLNELAPSYKIPSVTTVKLALDDKYNVVKERLKSRVSLSSYVSLTFDAWTETMSEKSFLGVTVHFLDGILLKSYCLAVSELKERHTAEYICETLQQILYDWDINRDKIVTVVTDNGANVVAAVNRLFGKSKHTPCFAHTINLVATNTVGQKNIQPIISKVREIVKWVKNSVVNSDILRKQQCKAGILEGNMKKLILDVSTCWNSVYFMIERFIQMLNFISPMLLDNCSAPPILTAIEIDILRQLLDLLKPLEFVTTESSGENYITISKVIPMISCLTKQMALIAPRFDVIYDVKDTLHAELHKRFGMIEQITPIAISTLLDPRFKNLHFNNPVASSNAMAALRKLLKLDVSSSESEGDTSNIETTIKDFDFWAHHKNLAHGQKKKKLSISASLNDELSLYLSNPVSPLKSDPLEQWEDMKNIFPTLYKQARYHFTMVATSVPCERLFSKAGATITKARNRLSSSRLQKLLLLADLTEEEWF